MRFHCWSSETSWSGKFCIFHLFGWINFESMKWGQGLKATRSRLSHRSVGKKKKKYHVSVSCKRALERNMIKKKFLKTECWPEPLTITNAHCMVWKEEYEMTAQLKIETTLSNDMTSDCFTLYVHHLNATTNSVHLPLPLSQSMETCPLTWFKEYTSEVDSFTVLV